MFDYTEMVRLPAPKTAGQYEAAWNSVKRKLINFTFLQTFYDNKTTMGDIRWTHSIHGCDQ
jgi:hypothetical protein